MDATQATPTRGRYAVGDGSQERPAPWITQQAWAGIIGPVLFTAAFLAQEAFRRSEYDPIAEPVSALAAGPGGWVQHVNFVVFGLLTIAFAIGLHRALRPTRAGIAGPALLCISGIGLLLAAVFPLREDAAGVTYDPGGHVVAGFLFFLSSALGLIVLSRRMARDPQWRGIAAYTLGVGIVALVGFVVGGRLVMPDHAPLHDWAGLYQRVLVVAVIFLCRIVLSIRLLRVATVSARRFRAGLSIRGVPARTHVEQADAQGSAWSRGKSHHGQDQRLPEHHPRRRHAGTRPSGWGHAR